MPLRTVLITTRRAGAIASVVINRGPAGVDGTGEGSPSATNLTASFTGSAVTILSSTGADVTLTAATESQAGIMTAADKALVNTITGKASLASPTFTGTPAAPTAAPGTNTTQLATTAFIQAAIAALINSAPGALDTLDELAAAMGDDANFASTITNALAGKLAAASNLSDLTNAATARTNLTLGNVENTALSTWAGSTNITTLGTIAAGTWQGSIIGPAYLGTGTRDGTRFLRDDGTYQAIPGGGDALTSGNLSQFATTTSAQLAGVISDETGSGALVFANSPALTGTPAAPTAAPGTNTTQLATTAFIQAALAALINSAPGALDTLDELAAAMGDDANFAATVTTALAGKQPLDATLTALAALATAADKLIYATGSDTFATADLTAFGRSLAAAANAAAVITLLGLGTAASKNTGTTSGTIPEFGTGGSLALSTVSISGETSYGNSATFTYGTGRAAVHRTALLAPGSDPTGITGADAVSNIVTLTQAEYDAIGSPNASTLYVIV